MSNEQNKGPPQHTPGPWEASEAGTVFAVPSDDAGDPKFICDCAQEPFIGANETDKANARLIAAAPEFDAASRELLATLQRFIDWDEGHLYLNGKAFPELQKPMQDLMDVVAKAAGGA